MPKREKNYLAEANDDAKDMALEFLDEIIEQIKDKGEASDDIGNDYGSGHSYHHETHVDRSYNLLEAATLLDQLYNYEETDAGLWEGQSPREAIGTQAAYTYGAAVYSLWSDLIKEINQKVQDENFDAGPKDWSPLKPKISLRKFIEQIIKEF